ncbi:MAG: T9SS type A sorting domain-containing protein [Flavobacteriales bacterium]|nr:T9SS type A sorting domain-containing protein [Flavobacteriales bacterium]
MKKALSFLVLLPVFSSILAQTTVISTFDQAVSETVESNGLLFFTASNGINGRELWRTDGTNQGTFMVKDIHAGSSDAFDLYFEYSAVNHNDVIYFKANDGIHGSELWRSDGTNSGTYMVKDITSGPQGSAISDFCSVGNKLFFVSGTSGNSLWKSDGSTNGTIPLMSFAICRNLTEWNGKVYFSASPDNSGEELWVSNGTSGSTQLLRDLNGVTGASLPINFRATPSRLFFMAATNIGWELWKTDGTFAGTQVVLDINPNGSSVLNAYGDALIANMGDTVYFVANDGTNGFQLWRSDGSEIGTYRITTMPVGVSDDTGFPIVDGKVLFSHWSLGRFWSFDPQTEIVEETNYPNLTHFSYPRKFIFHQGVQYYAAKDSLWGCEVWAEDGLENGGTLLQETHLTNNWATATGQGFNDIIGTINGKLLFIVAKGVTDSKQQLHAFDISVLDNCFHPAVQVVLSSSTTTLHFIWNRIPNAELYEVRYRKLGAPNWTTAITDRNYHTYTNLVESTDYEFEVRAQCNSSWTNWSPTQVQNTGETYTGTNLHIVAECSESPTIERLYWLKTDEIESLKVRYRPFGTTTWVQTFTNANGYKRITDLLPNTLYEYEYQTMAGGLWSLWSYSKRYFHTESQVVTSISIAEENEVLTYPNPSNGIFRLEMPNEFDNASYSVYDLSGQQVIAPVAIKGDVVQLNLSFLATGIYILRVSKNGSTTGTKNIQIIRE